MDYLSPTEARGMGGLRLVLTMGVPNPWGESAKGLFRLRGVDFAPVGQQPGGANTELRDWTGVRNAPVAVYEDEPPRDGWSQIVHLAERLGDGASLIPADPEDRAACFGVSHEICGEWGFGWSRRLMMLAPLAVERPDYTAEICELRRAYAISPETVAVAASRAAAVVDLVGKQLRAQGERGSPFLVGDALTFTDVHWACFSQMLRPLPADLNPMPENIRKGYAAIGPEIEDVLDEAVIEHRDRIFRQALQLPLDF